MIDLIVTCACLRMCHCHTMALHQAFLMSALPLHSVLRNLAMLTAQTELVMLGDLDMLIGTDLRDIFSNEDRCAILDSALGRRWQDRVTWQSKVDSHGRPECVGC